MSEMNTLEEERAHAYLKIREASIVRWGEERTAEIEDTLRKTSDSIARLSLFKFDHTDTPGAFLSEFGVDPETASQGNTSE